MLLLSQLQLRKASIIHKEKLKSRRLREEKRVCVLGQPTSRHVCAFAAADPSNPDPCPPPPPPAGCQWLDRIAAEEKAAAEAERVRKQKAQRQYKRVLQENAVLLAEKALAKERGRAEDLKLQQEYIAAQDAKEAARVKELEDRSRMIMVHLPCGDMSSSRVWL